MERLGARLLDELPDLAAGLHGDDLARARSLVVPAFHVEPGRWRWPEPADPRSTLGFVLLDGVLVRELRVVGHVPCTDLLGEGDVVRPWATRDLGAGGFAGELGWDVLRPARLALLDRRFTLAITGWPEVAAALLDRAIEQGRRALFRLSICQLPRVDARIDVLLWYLADRWGRVTPRGVVVPLPLPHRVLASMVAARRPSVTTALGHLHDAGRVERLGREGWLLHGDAPPELLELGAPLGVGAAGRPAAVRPGGRDGPPPGPSGGG